MAFELRKGDGRAIGITEAHRWAVGQTLIFPPYLPGMQEIKAIEDECMATTVTNPDGSVEVFAAKAKPVAKVETPALEVTPAAEPESPAEVETVEADEDTEDSTDAAEGELSERAKKIIAKQKRAIDKKHRAMREADELSRDLFEGRKAAERRAEELTAEIAALKSQTAAVSEKTRADFKNDEEWIDYRADLRLQVKEKERLQNEIKAERDKIERDFQARRSAYAEKVGDWEATMTAFEPTAPAITPAVEQYLYESDMGAEVLYHLAKHPSQYADIVQMKPTRAIKALGALEDSLAKPAGSGKTLTDAKPSISRAPAPTTPISESATPPQKDPMKMSTDEALAYFRAQRLAKARAFR